MIYGWGFWCCFWYSISICNVVSKYAINVINSANPIKAKYLVLVYGFMRIKEFNRMPGDNVAHLAHLGGMLIAYIILRYGK